MDFEGKITIYPSQRATSKKDDDNERIKKKKKKKQQQQQQKQKKKKKPKGDGYVVSPYLSQRVENL